MKNHRFFTTPSLSSQSKVNFRCSDCVGVPREGFCGEVEAGATFIVTSNGRAVAQLSPVANTWFTQTASMLAQFQGAPAVDTSTFAEDIDRFVDMDVQ